MWELTIYYLLIGTIVGFLLEATVRAVGEYFSWGERASVIILWPIMFITFMYNFIKGMFK